MKQDISAILDHSISWGPDTQQTGPAWPGAPLKGLEILCYMELREGDTDENKNIRSSRGVSE